LAPLPPYIQREDPAGQREEDRVAYQTVYASRPGAIAAPTAGLHFTPDTMLALDAAGHTRLEITLHVGAGTFAPVKVQRLEQHHMHQEWWQIEPAVAQGILQARKEGRAIIAVGTTTVRTLESWALQGFPEGAEGSTELFIRPPFVFQATDGILTNFHLPRSTLLMLVSAFHGRERLLGAYRQAVAARYRFFSFGDCMLLLPGGAHPVDRTETSA
ncbi:MAG TPA: S-adenosylmethionine:tRNA ribosyltransferase-isomerase, partial [bacterium]|nr:S-adenosylmethionine:tRNA ribosyltransferase-isomerase [bacterium]